MLPRLPACPIEVHRGLPALEVCDDPSGSFRVQKGQAAIFVGEDVFQHSDPIDLAEQVAAVIVHELIHYRLWWEGDVTPGHGYRFAEEAARVAELKLWWPTPGNLSAWPERGPEGWPLFADDVLAEGAGVTTSSSR